MILVLRIFPLFQVVVIDCKGHLLGRLASTIAKELLNGQKIVCVRTEEINISGSLFRNRMLFEHFMNKRMNTNPTRGQRHYRTPSRMLWRVVRGMMPHKTVRGAKALERLKVFEGCPHTYERLKRQVVPGALRTLRLRPGRKFCRLGDLANSVGWKHQALIGRLEAKRLAKGKAFYQTKLTLAKARSQAVATCLKNKDFAKKAQTLATLGYPVKA
jgi:large subunit ribosomal protein L13Ae